MFGLFIECIFYLIQKVFLFCCQENKPCACTVKKQRFHSQLCKWVALAKSFNQFWRRFSSREKCFILWTGNGRRRKKVDSSISLTLKFQKICRNEWYSPKYSLTTKCLWRQLKLWRRNTANLLSACISETRSVSSLLENTSLHEAEYSAIFPVQSHWALTLLPRICHQHQGISHFLNSSDSCPN